MVKLIRHSPVGSLISEACIAKIGKQLLFSLLCIFLTDTATSRLCHLFFHNYIFFMFSRLENWLFLKTFCFLFYYCKDNTKIPIYVLKHSVNLLYLTFNVYFILLFSIR